MSRKFNSAAFTAAWNNPDLTTDDIAAMFGVYRTSVSHMGQRRGLPPRKTGAKPKIDREPFDAVQSRFLQIRGAASCGPIPFGLDAQKHLLGIVRERAGT